MNLENVLDIIAILMVVITCIIVVFYKKEINLERGRSAKSDRFRNQIKMCLGVLLIVVVGYFYVAIN